MPRRRPTAGAVNSGGTHIPVPGSPKARGLEEVAGEGGNKRQMAWSGMLQMATWVNDCLVVTGWHYVRMGAVRRTHNVDALREGAINPTGRRRTDNGKKRPEDEEQDKAFEPLHPQGLQHPRERTGLTRATPSPSGGRASVSRGATEHGTKSTGEVSPAAIDVPRPGAPRIATMGKSRAALSRT